MTAPTAAVRLPHVRSAGAAPLARVRVAALAHRASLLWLGPVLLVGAVVNLLNLAGSPQRIDDEGTYVAQAWAVTRFGELAHYTFWYDHPPLGWLQLAGYAQLTGAFARWDTAVLAGREAMVVAALISVVLVWTIGRRLGLGRPAAAVAGLVFAVSPLAVQFHRTVYLDNIATPWLLLSVLLAMNRRGQLAAFAGSAAALGIAVLSKETYLLALPLVAWVMIRGAHRDTRRYTLSVAGAMLVLVGGGYLLLAAVKGELLPGPDRVSLATGIAFQLGGRASSGSIADPGSLVLRTLSMWWQLDPALIVTALAAALMALAVPRLRALAVFVLALVAFMFRPGGYLPVPYVIMLLPFAALLIAGVGDAAVKALRGRQGLRRVIAASAAVALALGAAAAVPLWVVQLRGFVLSDLDAPVRNAETWVADNVGRDQRLIVDDAMWVDLVRDGWDRSNVIWYYKLDTDPAVQAQSPNGWADSDWIITTGSMRTFPASFPQVQQAITNSVIVATFGEGDQAVEVRRIDRDGVDAAATDLRASTQSQAALGAQLARNPALTFDGGRDELTSGAVDGRLILVLGALSADRTLTIAGFPTVDGEDAARSRQVALTALDGDPTVVDGEPTQAVLDMVDRLTGAYALQDVHVDGSAVLLQVPLPAL